MTAVTLFGTRGSIASPGPESVRYGGNTSTVQVLGDDGTVLVLDAGTGIRRLGAQVPSDAERVDVVLTHLHMDHIQGLGFFGPLYDPDVEVHLWGPCAATTTLAKRLSRYLSPPLFPVHLRDLPRVTCHDLPSGTFEVGSFRVDTELICHPNPTLGVRIDDGRHVLAYMPDHEPALGLGDRFLDNDWTSGAATAFRADLLIHDAQYTDGEYADRVGWGHSSYAHTFELARRLEVAALVPFHHDPSHDDATLDRLFAEAVERFAPTFQVIAGCEGTTIVPGSP